MYTVWNTSGIRSINGNGNIEFISERNKIMIDGSNIQFQSVMELIVYGAVIGIAISILIWFIGYVMRTVISLINKAMTL